MRRILIFLLVTSFTITVHSQGIPRPKLVVGVVVDQMRWDYLYRYYDRFDARGGFKRLLSQGFTCENTMIPYAPTVTAPGHSSIYTGSVPAITGITGNYWWDREQMRSVYCTEDRSVNTVGSSTKQGQMSPRNMLTTTIGDELRLATNFRSKVIGIAIKDRGSILPAGHTANAAYWYDMKEGNWISSTYYMNELPNWVKDFNKQKWVDKYYEQGWSLLYPASTYIQSTEEEKPYEKMAFGKKFPYDLKAYIGKDYAKIDSTPMGNSFTLEFAKAVINGEQLGADNITDMLAVSFSSTDYIGHAFGPNSVEAEDAMLRLDRDLGRLLDFLDLRIGKGQYLLFLSADHGVAHVPEFMQEHKIPAGRWKFRELLTAMNLELDAKYKVGSLITSIENYQVNLNHRRIDSAGLPEKDLVNLIVARLMKDPLIDRAFPLEKLNDIPLPATIRKMLNNGYYPRRSGDIQVILKPGVIEGYNSLGTTHGLWNPYDAHIPLLWYGWGIKHGKSNKEVYMTDITPTIAALLHIQVPSGCIGQPIEDVMK